MESMFIDLIKQLDILIKCTLDPKDKDALRKYMERWHKELDKHPAQSDPNDPRSPMAQVLGVTDKELDAPIDAVKISGEDLDMEGLYSEVGG